MSNSHLDVKETEIKEKITTLPSGVSHSFDTGYAIAYGVDEAIMIRNLQFFITCNANRGNNFHEGRFWTYDKLKDFPNHFPYWTSKQIRRIIDSLVDQGVIIKGNFNTQWSDQTCWYAFKDEANFIKHVKTQVSDNKPTTEMPKRATDRCPNENLTDAQMGNSLYVSSPITASLSSSSSLKVPTSPESKSAKASEVEVPKKRISSDFSPKIREVGQKILDLISQVKEDWPVPKNLFPFLTQIDLMIRLDKRDPQKMQDVFAWALSDSFWCDKMIKPNPAKYLREKFDQLEMKMNAKPPKKERRFAPCSTGEVLKGDLYKEFKRTAL